MFKRFPIKETHLVYFLAVLNALVIGISFLFVKLTLNYTTPLDSLMYRFSAALILFLLVSPFIIKRLNYRNKPLYKLVILASLYPLGYFMLQALGLEHASSVEGGIINAFTPVVTMILASLFIKEETTARQKEFTYLSVFGIVFIFVMKSSNVDFTQLHGVTLLLLATVFFAGYSVLGRSLSKQFSPLEISFFMVSTGFVISLFISITTNSAKGTLHQLIMPLTDESFYLLIFYLGFVQLATALMGSYILSRMEAWKVSVFLNVSTICSIIAGALILNEKVTWYHLLGAAFILFGVCGSMLVNRSENNRSKVVKLVNNHSTEK